MKHAKDLLGTPTKDILQIEHNGVRYIATEEDCRFLQTLVIDGKVKASEYKIIDTQQENEYEISVDPETGLLTNSIQSNTYSFNSDFTLIVLKNNRNKKQNK